MREHGEAPHPEWTAGEPWPREVSSYAVDDGERLLLFVFGVRRRWTSDLRHRCSRPVKVRGVLDPHSGSPRLLVGRKIVLIDGHTRYHGPRRSGLPYLRGGERVTVRGRTCPDTRVMAQVIRARR